MTAQRYAKNAKIQMVHQMMSQKLCQKLMSEPFRFEDRDRKGGRRSLSGSHRGCAAFPPDDASVCTIARRGVSCQ
ncbi:hypothetical protein GCM10009857_10310 [Agromyces soli]